MRLNCTDKGCFLEETGGCVGDCCANFSLTQAMQLEIMNGQDEESETIRSMLIPLGDGHFTCRHWNSRIKLCFIYAERPQMCRDFPAKGNPCGAPGCKEPNH